MSSTGSIAPENCLIMMPSWSNRLRINPWTALLVLVAVGVFGFLSGDSPAVAQGTLPAPTNGTAVSNTAGERTLASGWGRQRRFIPARRGAHMSETFDYARMRLSRLMVLPEPAPITGLTGGCRLPGHRSRAAGNRRRLGNTSYGVAELVAAQGVDSQCSADDYDRDEWGEYPGAPDDATPTWTLPRQTTWHQPTSPWTTTSL